MEGFRDKEYLSLFGEIESRASKSTYSFPQTLFLTLALTLLPKATAMLANGLSAGLDNGVDKILACVPSGIEAASLTTVSTSRVSSLGDGTVVDETCSNACLKAWDTTTEMSI